MKKWLLKLIAVFLAVSVFLSGCSLDFEGYFQTLGAMLLGLTATHYEDMEYIRPDMTELQQALDACNECAAGTDFGELVDALETYTMLYYDFYTAYALANIRYYTDLTDIYWTDEYNYCLEMSAEVDAGLDQLYYTLADSEHREDLESEEFYGEGFFDDYEGESIWDETFTALMEEEAEILSRYYEWSTQASEADWTEYYETCVPEMCQIYVELVALRQEIAEYAGFDSFAEFAYDFYYVRDYTPQQETAYLEQVKQELVPLYRDLYEYGVEGLYLDHRTEEETYAYVSQMADSMGGTIAEAFQFMEEAGLYDITYGENKYNASFEIYIASYGEPFVFLNPNQSDYDYLTFAHEFGHFCNDYATYGGSAVGIDVAEIFSQGMEYLSLFYVEDTEMLERLKMVDSLCVYVEQAAYADFEQRVYALSPEELTVENVIALFGQVGTEYGFDSWGFDSQDFVGIPHFFISPMYVFSYVVSNDAAMQFYQLEQAEAGAGLQRLEENLDTEEAYFLAFLESADLESPFAEGRIQSVRETFKEVLGS